MSSSRILSKLTTNLPKYTGRTGALLSTGTSYITLELLNNFDHIWGSSHRYTTKDSLMNLGAALLFFAPPGYAAGYVGGKAIAKVCELSAKTGIPQAAARFIKKL